MSWRRGPLSWPWPSACAHGGAGVCGCAETICEWFLLLHAPAPPRWPPAGGGKGERDHVAVSTSAHSRKTLKKRCLKVFININVTYQDSRDAIKRLVDGLEVFTPIANLED